MDALATICSASTSLGEYRHAFVVTFYMFSPVVDPACRRGKAGDLQSPVPQYMALLDICTGRLCMPAC